MGLLGRVVAEQLTDHQLELGERLGADGFALAGGEDHEVAVRGPALDDEDLALGIDDPVVSDARAMKRPPLGHVVTRGRWREDLADPVRAVKDGAVGRSVADAVAPPARQVGDVDLVVLELDLDLGEEPPAPGCPPPPRR